MSKKKSSKPFVYDCVAWITKGRKKINKNLHGDKHLDAPFLPFFLIGEITSESFDQSNAYYDHNGREQVAIPYSIEHRFAGMEPFPLKLLLDIGIRAIDIHEESFVKPVNDTDSGYYTLTEEEASKRAVVEVLGCEYDALGRFVYLAFRAWPNDMQELRDSLKAGTYPLAAANMIAAQEDDHDAD